MNEGPSGGRSIHFQGHVNFSDVRNAKLINLLLNAGVTFDIEASTEAPPLAPGGASFFPTKFPKWRNTNFIIFSLCANIASIGVKSLGAPPNLLTGASILLEKALPNDCHYHALRL